MLLSLDKYAKQKILEYYKEESIKRQRREELERKILEDDKKFLKNMEEIEQEELNKIKDENEYNTLLIKSKNYCGRTSPIIPYNNEYYGEPEEELILPEIRDSNYKLNNFNILTQREKEKIITRPIDHMKDYLTDRENLNQLKKNYKIRKNNKKNFYKDIFYNQYINAVDKNIKMYGTNDELILRQRKKKFLSENPYQINREKKLTFNFLDRNPIVNPSNDIDYNKYVDISLNLRENKHKNNFENNFFNKYGSGYFKKHNSRYKLNDSKWNNKSNNNISYNIYNDNNKFYDKFSCLSYNSYLKGINNNKFQINKSCNDISTKRFF